MPVVRVATWGQFAVKVTELSGTMPKSPAWLAVR
jgi:hypothetical protein